jgi:hypothetical protein
MLGQRFQLLVRFEARRLVGVGTLSWCRGESHSIRHARRPGSGETGSGRSRLSLPTAETRAMCEGLGPLFAGAKPCMDFTTSSTKPSKILRHVETADPTRSARIRSAIRQIEETIVLARRRV